MAKITLPTNYRDDILNSSAEGKRKYIMSYNQDGTVSFEDVTPYEQVGSDFGAGDINTTNESVNESFDKNKLVKDLDTINALTEEGYAPDALAVKQLNESLVGALEWKSVGSGTCSGGVSIANVLSNAHELYIEAHRNNTSITGSDAFNYSIPINTLPDSGIKNYYNNSYVQGSAPIDGIQMITVDVSNKKIKVIMRSGSNDVSSSSGLWVYYR